MGRKLGGCALFGEGQLGPHLTQCDQGRGLCMPSLILIRPRRPTVWSRYSNVTGRQTGQDNVRTDSIGRTVLQTVATVLQTAAQNRAVWSNFTKIFSCGVLLPLNRWGEIWHRRSSMPNFTPIGALTYRPCGAKNLKIAL